MAQFLFRWCRRCPVCRAGLSAGRLCKCSPACGCSPSCWDAAAPRPGRCSSVRGPRQASVAGAQWPAGRELPAGRAGPSRCSMCPSCMEEQPRGVPEAPSSLPSLPLGFRCTNPRGRTLPLQPVRGTSPPPRLRWAPPAVRTPLKRRRPPCRVTPAITLDCPPILMSGMCEGSCCPATDWTKCIGNEAKKGQTKPTAARSHGNGVSTPTTA